MNYYKDEPKECLSNYQDYLFEKGEFEYFVFSLKKDHDSSWDKSSYNETLSLQKSFSSNEINNSFINNSIDDDRGKEDFNFLSNIEIYDKTDNIKKEKKMCNKKQIIFKDIPLNSNDSEIENLSFLSNKKERVVVIPNISKISKKRYLNMLKKLKSYIGINLEVKLYELQLYFDYFPLIIKNRKESKYLEKKKTRALNYLKNKYLMTMKFILLFQILVRDKISFKKHNDVELIKENNNPFKDLKCKYIIRFYNLNKSVNYRKIG